MFDLIRADLRRKRKAFGVRPEDQTFFKKFVSPLLEFGTWAVMMYRFGSWATRIKNPVLRLPVMIIFHMLNVICMIITGIHIQRESRIGGGLIVHNFSCIHVLCEEMGEDCTLNQGVTIGNIRGQGRPVIGNNVYIGTGAKVLGGVKVGNNVVIGPNSFVVADVPDDVTVVGVPARVISRSATSPYMKLGSKDVPPPVMAVPTRKEPEIGGAPAEKA